MSLPTDWRPREPKRTSIPCAPCRKLQESGRCRVAAVTLHMAEQNKSLLVSHVAVARQRVPLEECSRLSAHGIVAGRSAAPKDHQVLAGLRQEAAACLAANDVRTSASERRAFHPASAWFASPPPLDNFDQEDAGHQYERDECPRTMIDKRRSRMGMRWRRVLCIRAWEP